MKVVAILIAVLGALALQSPSTSLIGLMAVVGGAAMYNKHLARPLPWYWLIPIVAALALIVVIALRMSIKWLS